MYTDKIDNEFAAGPLEYGSGRFDRPVCPLHGDLRNLRHRRRMLGAESQAYEGRGGGCRKGHAQGDMEAFDSGVKQQ